MECSFFIVETKAVIPIPPTMKMWWDAMPLGLMPRVICPTWMVVSIVRLLCMYEKPPRLLSSRAMPSVKEEVVPVTIEYAR